MIQQKIPNKYFLYFKVQKNNLYLNFRMNFEINILNE